MSQFSSVQEFLRETDLSEKMSPEDFRKGKFITIYASKSGGNKGLVSAETVEEYSLQKYRGIYIRTQHRVRKHRKEDTFHAVFSTFPDLGTKVRKDSGNLKFDGGQFLSEFGLWPPVMWKVVRMESRNSEQTTLEIKLKDFIV